MACGMYRRIFGIQEEGNGFQFPLNVKEIAGEFITKELAKVYKQPLPLTLPVLRRSRAVYPDMYSNEEDEDDDVITNAQKRFRGKRSSNHVLPGQSQQQPSAADLPSGPAVEFFNPKIRNELEKKDADYLKRTGLKGAAPGGDAWVWLTSYSRIPVSRCPLEWHSIVCTVWSK